MDTGTEAERSQKFQAHFSVGQDMYKNTHSGRLSPTAFIRTVITW